MKCKKCGHDINKDWKYCPNCSKRIYKKRNIIIISTIALIIIIFIVIFTIKSNMPINEKYIEKKLEKKYSEDFDNVSFLKSVENADTDLSCDGSSFGTIKGEGSTEYYKVYSPKNNMEFIASYDTSDETKKIKDSYEKNLKKRSALIQTYETISNYMHNIDHITLSGSDNNINIDSKNQLESILSKYEEKNVNLDDIEIYINENLYDFCKTNYENITKLNDEIVKLQKNNDYYFSTIIVLNSQATIELYRLNDKPYVYDKYSTAWGETLDEFVMRESY